MTINPKDFFGPKHSSIHMPRWASRLTLHIAETRIERLQDITPEDCVAEGYEITGMRPDPETGDPIPREDYWRPFAAAWDCLHGEGSWDTNPDVVVISFRAEPENIDRVAEMMDD